MPAEQRPAVLLEVQRCGGPDLSDPELCHVVLMTIASIPTARRILPGPVLRWELLYLAAGSPEL